VTAGGGPAGPLAGRRILVTRRPEQSGALVSRLRALGAVVVELPTIAIAPPADVGPLDRALANLHRYEWMVFSSANAVRAVADRLSALGLSASPRGTALASVGESTSEAIRERFPGREVAIQPASEFRAEGLVEAFLARGVAGQRFLVPAAEGGRDVLARSLADMGARVDVVAAYQTVAPSGLAEEFRRILQSGLDLATFASPSSVQNLEAAAPAILSGLRAAVIGPVTEDAARRAGLDVAVVAHPSTAAGLVDAILRHFGAAAPS